MGTERQKLGLICAILFLATLCFDHGTQASAAEAELRVRIEQIAIARSRVAVRDGHRSWSELKLGGREQLERTVSLLRQLLKVTDGAARRAIDVAAGKINRTAVNLKPDQGFELQQLGQQIPVVQKILDVRHLVARSLFALELWNYDFSAEGADRIWTRAEIINQRLMRAEKFTRVGGDRAAIQGQARLYSDDFFSEPDFLMQIFSNFDRSNIDLAQMRSDSVPYLEYLSGLVHRSLNRLRRLELQAAQEASEPRYRLTQMGAGEVQLSQADHLKPMALQPTFDLGEAWVQSGDPYFYIPGGQISSSCNRLLQK